MSRSYKIKLQNSDVSFDCIDKIVDIEKEAHLNPWTKTSFTSALEANDLVKKFTQKNEIIGYFVAKIVLDQCELLNLTVKKNKQSKGIGKLILIHLKELCLKTGIHYIFLEVRRSNRIAINLYERIGFNETGIRKNYYKTEIGKEDAILMGLSL